MNKSQETVISDLLTLGVQAHPAGSGVYVSGHGYMSILLAATYACDLRKQRDRSTPGTDLYRQHVESLGQRRLPVEAE